jgi:hypothetical protein
MPPPSVWGPPIWTFFHVLSCKVKEDKFTQFIKSWHPLMIKICGLLPCPECSQHATQFLGRVNLKDVPNKETYMNLLHFFHNSVNKRKGKPHFPPSFLEKYKHMDIQLSLKQFLRAYNVKGNMNMINESFRRSFVIKDIQNWIKWAAVHNIF